MTHKKKCKPCQEAEDALKAQLAEMTEHAKRAVADLQNYKRRIEEDQKNFVQFAVSGLLLELLPILNNFERAIKHIPDETSEFGKGIIQIYNHLKQILEKAGLTQIQADPGTIFNPNFHEALLQGQGEKDKITEELEKGYMLGEKVLKPAKVKVGNGS